MVAQATCPACGKPLAADAPQGLCPACLLKAGLPTASHPGEDFTPLSVADVARLFPQFEILELIGKGGMGAVYKARQPGLDRVIALKLLPPRTGNDPGFAERFAREARMLAKLSHPHIVTVHDFGRINGLHYFVMEYVDGPNLRQLQHTGKLSPREALRIIPQICEALQFAHDEGVVHRDIKPENVLINQRGQIKIADFGLAKILGQHPANLRLTGAKDIMGTPHYMAPEQVEHPQDVDHRADIYSLGVVFYEILTGELPLGRFAPPSRKVEVDVRLDQVILRTLEKERERRYQHASEVKSDVERISVTAPPQRSMSVRSRFPWLWVGIPLVLLLLIAGFALLRRSRELAAPPAVALRTWNDFAHQRPISGEVLPSADEGWVVNSISTQAFRLFEVPDPGVENCTVLYQARLKTENLAGRAYLEMWAHLPGLGESFSRGLHNVATGSNEWATYETPFYLKAGERPDRIRLNLVVEGQGKVYIKDIVLTATPQR